MSDLGFTLAFITNYSAKDALPDEDISPASYAMHWCMTAVYMNRLFTREDMEEFLFRLAIVLDTMGVAENWFCDGKLFTYQYKEQYFALDAEDVLAHFGFEVTDAVRNGNTREYFLENVKKGIQNAMFTSIFGKCQVIAPDTGAEDSRVIDAAKHSPEISDKLIRKAEAFARDMMKQVPASHFTEINEARLEKLAEIEERKRRIAMLPEFDLDLVPRETVEECMKLMLCPAGWKSYYLDMTEEEARDEEYRLIYFAWLWANDMMVSDGVMAWEVEGASLDYDEYELEDGGINLLATYEMYNVEEATALLEGVGCKSKSQ